MKLVAFLICMFLTLSLTGCQIDEVRTKLKGGPEFRDDGLTNHERWTSQIGLETKLSNGHTVGVTYRRRDNSHADGWNKDDNGVWLEYSFPLWKREKPDRTIALQKEIDELREELKEIKGTSQ